MLVAVLLAKKAWHINSNSKFKKFRATTIASVSERLLMIETNYHVRFIKKRAFGDNTGAYFECKGSDKVNVRT